MMPNLPLFDVPARRLVLFGVGFHPVVRNASLDLNNKTMKKLLGPTYSAWAYRSKLNFKAQRDYWFESPCLNRRTLGTRGSEGQVIWVPPHFKPTIGRYDDSNERGRNFSLDSARYFGEDCGTPGIPTLDFDEPTRAAARLLCRGSGRCATVDSYVSQKACKLVLRDSCRDASWVTNDGVHWGQTINVVKAQLLLAYLDHAGAT